ncbi:MAG: type II toxin-antitoxin system Phd/YefM family antitoxin [Gammaproteobacteria bacterium]|nr:type II toxin-antitoxin system Phd/YefM family antitoxin [Gammaproteobacteria bacterium]
MQQIKSISYLKSNAANIVRSVGEQPGTYVVTQYGEAKAVLQSYDDYERTQETLALLKIFALGDQQVSAGRVSSAKDVFARIRARRQL